MCVRERGRDSVSPADTPVPPRQVVVFAIVLKAVESGSLTDLSLSIYIHITITMCVREREGTKV